MNDLKKANIVLSDLKTFKIILMNQNYGTKLRDMYKYYKSFKINSYEDFCKVSYKFGGFTYDEVTIFDRITNSKYRNLLSTTLYQLDNEVMEYVNNPKIGDELTIFKM